MRMTEHFFLGRERLFFSLGKRWKKKCEHSVRNQSLTLYRIKKH